MCKWTIVQQLVAAVVRAFGTIIKPGQLHHFRSLAVVGKGIGTEKPVAERRLNQSSARDFASSLKNDVGIKNLKHKLQACMIQNVSLEPHRQVITVCYNVLKHSHNYVTLLQFARKKIDI